MASIYNMKPTFQNLLRPLTHKLIKWHITPNQITLGAVFLSFMWGCLLFIFPHDSWPLFLLPLILFIRMGLNAIDGMLAREHQLQTAFGTYLNELGDVVSDICIYLPFTVLPRISSSLIVTIVILAIISEMSGIMAVQVDAPRRYDGPMGKSDRAFVFGIAALLFACGCDAIWINLLFSIVTLLLFVTIYNRINGALRIAS